MRTVLVSNDKDGEFWSIYKALHKDTRGPKARALLALHETRELGAGRRRIVDTGAQTPGQSLCADVVHPTGGPAAFSYKSIVSLGEVDNDVVNLGRSGDRFHLSIRGIQTTEPNILTNRDVK